MLHFRMQFVFGGGLREMQLYWFCWSFHGLFLFPPLSGLWMSD